MVVNYHQQCPPNSVPRSCVGMVTAMFDVHRLNEAMHRLVTTTVRVVHHHFYLESEATGDAHRTGHRHPVSSATAPFFQRGDPGWLGHRSA